MKLVNKIKKYQSINRILVVDNNSTDESYEKLSKINDVKCEVIKTNKNGGYAYGNNYGFKYLIKKFSLDLIFIANPDVSFENSLIEDIKIAFIRNEKYAVLSGIMLDGSGNPNKVSFWNIPSFLEDIFDCIYLFRAIKRKLKVFKVDKTRKIMDVQVVPGSFFGIKSEVFELVGGFDENTFLFYEENILASKIMKHGYLEGILTYNSYCHLHSVSIKKSLSVIKTHLIHLKSKFYYQSAYNKVNNINKVILFVFMGYSLIETIILAPLKSICRQLINKKNEVMK
ncbi:glycosyltransferase [Clostridium estertheticum]|nr:glycosyltransferase [Clostridium estertheticum]